MGTAWENSFSILTHKILVINVIIYFGIIPNKNCSVKLIK
jgi:hypothetical protein